MTKPTHTVRITYLSEGGERLANTIEGLSQSQAERLVYDMRMSRALSVHSWASNEARPPMDNPHDLMTKRDKIEAEIKILAPKQPDPAFLSMIKDKALAQAVRDHFGAAPPRLAEAQKELAAVKAEISAITAPREVVVPWMRNQGQVDEARERQRYMASI